MNQFYLLRYVPALALYIGLCSYVMAQAPEAQSVDLLVGKANSGDGTQILIGSGTFEDPNPGGPGAVTGARRVNDVAVAPDGTIYYADATGAYVASYDPATTNTKVIAGTVNSPGGTGDGGPASLALLDNPLALEIDDKTGDLYIAEQVNATIRVVDGETGIISLVKKFDDELFKMTLAGDTGMYVSYVSKAQIDYLDFDDGSITRIAGTGEAGTPIEDQLATEATIATQQHALAVSPDGELYFTSNSNFRVYKIDGENKIQFAAGAGSPGNSDIGDVEDPEDVAFRQTYGLAFDRNGDLYIADWVFPVVRKLVFDDEKVYTLAGGGWGSKDMPDTSRPPIPIPYPGTIDAPFGDIGGIAIDPQGNVIVAGFSGALFRVNMNDTYNPLVSFENLPASTEFEFTFQVVFTEEVSGLETSDFTVDNGSIISMNTEDNITYDVTIGLDEIGTLTISLPEGAAKDDADLLSPAISKTVDVTDIKILLGASIQESIDVYPNPASSQINFSGSSSPIISVRIIAMDGKTVLDRQVNETIQSLSIETLEAGLYNLSIQYEDGSTHTQKIIKK